MSTVQLAQKRILCGAEDQVLILHPILSLKVQEQHLRVESGLKSPAQKPQQPPGHPYG